MKKIIIGKKRKKNSENLNWAYCPIVLKKNTNFFLYCNLGFCIVREGCSWLGIVLQYTILYFGEGGLRVEFVLQYRKLYCKSWLVLKWKGIVLQDYQVYCNKKDCWRVYCHRLVAKEVYCNITCRLKKNCIAIHLCVL